ncbi:MAG: acetyl-CoA carboxylase carboxyltransferase subunit alpha [Actinomycetia bacterium]|nr:acetyl-CoA carboxylase carboxyltransferase subunit alpha [Actinomycetes bacterium]
MRKIILDFEKPLVELEKKLELLKKLPSSQEEDIIKEITSLEEEIGKLREKIYLNLTPWQKVQLSRHPERPKTLDYIGEIFTDFIELHGDRLFKDDPAIVCGLAYLEDYKVAIVGHQKGKNVTENIIRNFGMPHPEGYRKALRLMKLAEKFSLPIISFIDTQGAYPGIGAEERGQAWAIAENIKTMGLLKTPIIAVNIGEGGSGGALAVGVGDKLLMLENAYYSVITPEGCASILWQDPSKASKAAEALKLTANELKEMGIVDEIIPEPLGGAQEDSYSVSQKIKDSLLKNLNILTKKSPDKLVSARWNRIKNAGTK